jgi:hypothetical protein
MTLARIAFLQTLPYCRPILAESRKNHKGDKSVNPPHKCSKECFWGKAAVQNLTPTLKLVDSRHPNMIMSG